MIGSIKHSLKTATLLLLIVACANAQTPQKTGTSGVAGQIKIAENAAPGIAVSLISADARGPGTQTSARATTDAEGRYQISNLTAGRYRVMVMAPGYVVSGSASTLQVGEGQPLRGIDFVLTKGAIITGRVTVNGDRPVIGEPVILTPIDENGQPARSPVPNGNNFRTDDRGIYRIYGLAAGKYWVSVGRGDDFGGGRGGPGAGFSNANDAPRTWQRTYYPDAIESAQASIVEVESGKEVLGIDIRMALRETYAIAGRVVDSETGKPVAGVLIGHGRTSARGNGGRGAGGNEANRARGNNPGNGGNRSIVTSSSTDGTSGAEGEFRIEGLGPGSYAVFVAQDQAAGQTDFYSDPVGVEISSQDVSDIEIKLQRGVSISGLVVFEGANDPKTIASLSNIVISAQSRGGRGSGSGIMMMNNVSSPVEATGGFRVAGLSPGLVNLNVRDISAPGPFSGLTVLRIERNGADVQSGLRAESGEQVTGVRVVLAIGNSVVRGSVKVEGGALMPGTRLMVSARRVSANTGPGGRMNGGTNAQVDANGRFQLERLIPGTYQISVQARGGRNGQNSNSGTATQTINVGAGTVQDIPPFNLETSQGGQGGNRPSGRPSGRRP